jgi:hypothetical protein
MALNFAGSAYTAVELFGSRHHNFWRHGETFTNTATATGGNFLITGSGTVVFNTRPAGCGHVGLAGAPD